MPPKFRVPFGEPQEETQYATPRATHTENDNILAEADSTLDRDDLLPPASNRPTWSQKFQENTAESRKRLPLILKNSPSRTFTEPMNSSTPLSGIQHKIPPKMGRVLFSPTTEVINYEESFDKEKRKNERPLETPTNADFFDNYTRPYILLMYLQLFFNVVLALVVLYIIFSFITTIRADTKHKIELATTDALREISLCSREYYRNKCSTDRRTPALEVPCLEWEKCMNRDPEKIGKSLVTAHTFGEIINEFLKPISWKLIFLLNLILIGSFIATNVLMGSFRRENNYEQLDNLKKLKAMEKRLRDTEIELEEMRRHNSELQKRDRNYLTQQDLALVNDSINYSPLMAKLRR